MSDEHKQYATTPASTLEQHITDLNIAKSETEWWAYHEIERLRAENEKLRAALKAFTDELSPAGLVAFTTKAPDDYTVKQSIPCGIVRAAKAALGESDD